MNMLYNSLLTAGNLFLHLIARLSFLLPRPGKFRKFAEGQLNLIQRIRTEMEPVHAADLRSVVWIHASSLGEYGVVRPVIRRLRQEQSCRIVLTFFSSTGYEALKQWHPDVDHLFYLPLDTRGNVCAFLDAVRPTKAVFVVSEYWINYLEELKRREIPAYLLSAVISRKAPFFKWYGGMFRRSLAAFRHFMVLNQESTTLLRQLGYKNLTVTGDPLFDNAIAVASTPWRNEVVERFAAGRPLFVAGSVSDHKDMNLICTLANRHRETRFVIVPHEICEETLNELKFRLEGYTLCYSECNEATDFGNTQVLIIDFLGALAYLYRYGTWAYVGGGFTPYLHSLIEATVYGLPVSFGPRTERKVTPHELIDLGIGHIVRTSQELDQWFGSLKENPDELARIRDAARQYTQRNSGATPHIIRLLTEA